MMTKDLAAIEGDDPRSAAGAEAAGDASAINDTPPAPQQDTLVRTPPEYRITHASVA